MCPAPLSGVALVVVRSEIQARARTLRKMYLVPHSLCRHSRVLSRSRDLGLQRHVAMRLGGSNLNSPGHWMQGLKIASWTTPVIDYTEHVESTLVGST